MIAQLFRTDARYLRYDNSRYDTIPFFHGLPFSWLAPLRKVRKNCINTKIFDYFWQAATIPYKKRVRTKKVLILFTKRFKCGRTFYPIFVNFFQKYVFNVFSRCFLIDGASYCVTRSCSSCFCGYFETLTYRDSQRVCIPLEIFLNTIRASVSGEWALSILHIKQILRTLNKEFKNYNCFLKPCSQHN